VWRVVDVGKSSLPPVAWQPLLDRSASFHWQKDERSGFGMPEYYSDKTKEGPPDPYDIQRDDYSG
jgi:hypothetical protein